MNGTTQRWNPEKYREHAGFVADLGVPVVELLSPRPEEKILDLGCGDGVLTAKIAALSCSVVGVDSSPEMVAAARARNVEASVLDGQSLTYREEFDAVFSNAALHWMNQPRAVIAGVWRALKPGGRFVGEFGGFGNVATIIAAIEAALIHRRRPFFFPWYFPRPDEYEALLREAGFAVSSVALFPRRTPLPGDMSGWLEMFAQPFLGGLSVAERKELVQEIIELLRPALCENGKWFADYVRLRFAATKPNP